MRFRQLKIKKNYSIRESCTDILRSTLDEDYPNWRVVAVVPLTLTITGNSPVQHEVTEIEVLLEPNRD